MVKIKLLRIGKKHEPHFRIVVAEAKSKATGVYVENLGTYNPIKKDFSLNREKYDGWMSKGAVPTDTVKSIVQKYSKTA